MLCHMRAGIILHASEAEFEVWPYVVVNGDNAVYQGLADDYHQPKGKYWMATMQFVEIHWFCTLECRCFWQCGQMIHLAVGRVSVFQFLPFKMPGTKGGLSDPHCMCIT